MFDFVLNFVKIIYYVTDMSYLLPIHTKKINYLKH